MMNLRPKEPGLAKMALTFALCTVAVAPFSTWHMPVFFGTLAVIFLVSAYTRS